ncbi:MAG TPA: hypothetical protein VKZ67_03240 [Natronosporangium sp.]|nr:hypothetical protein [Natronosporangium sp.]
MINGRTRWDEDTLRVLVPRALASLIRRGEDFDTAEAAHRATNTVERDHLVRQAARCRVRT